jgi:formylglycine-generating enzyme required for sulfatase activity
MSPSRKIRALASALALLALATLASAGGTATIAGGTYEPFYPIAGEESVELPPFELDVAPVTNAEFLAFVTDHPDWRRGTVPTVFADPGYLAHWASPTTLGEAGPSEPVTNVSWFAANAYCAAQDKHLPTEAEWEFAAWADGAQTDARADPVRRAQLLALYASRGTLRGVATTRANAWGVHDLHDLVWEWVEDFQATLAMADSRNDGARDLQLFCGGASLGARDRTDYASFMRYAFRNGLAATTTTGGLGFRCAR